MTTLAVFLVALGSLVVGSALSTRALAREHDALDRKRVLLDLERREAVRARETYERLAAELRGSIHLEAPGEQRVVIDLGAHRRARGVLQ